MMTGTQYVASLQDGRRVYLDGERIDDVTTDAGLGQAVRIVARGYDALHRPGDDARNPAFTIPRTADELRARCELLVHHDVTLSLSAVAMALLTSSPALTAADPAAGERIRHWFDECAARDVRFAELITDAKGDRTLAPSQQDDPDLYVRVVDRDRDGVVIRGAKFHTTAGPIVHELVVLPTKRMKAGEEQYAIACAVPANAPGVIQITSSHHARHGHPRDRPVSAQLAIPDSMVVFDDVHVPYERVFLDGDVARSAVIAHSLGLWERLSGVAHMAHLGDQLAGMAQLAAEANGTAGIPHIKEKIAEIVIYATMTRACLEAALGNVDVNEDGMLLPSELYTNAGKLHAATGYAVMVRHLHDIAGGTVVTAPSFADVDNPETAGFIEKYLRGARGITADHRLALFHTIRNMTADEWGGREAVSWLQSGGGLFAQRTVTRNHYDMNAAKSTALALMEATDG
ncbi:MAG: 4-hydroxyphenylacetate 3-hydroxylase N-terminal domain-containing protein [Actinomycetota bacterium]|nr:4-hydroxyphenylacetate 3-hydroxylase N-terminal domain-containing protein [Actinomycetota bacterium]